MYYEFVLDIRQFSARLSLQATKEYETKERWLRDVRHTNIKARTQKYVAGYSLICNYAKYAS